MHILSIYLRNKIKWHSEYMQAAEKILDKVVLKKYPLKINNNSNS